MPKNTTPHAAVAAGFEPGGYALFTGYTNMEEGQVAVLTEGMPVRIDRFENEADIVVVGVDDDGNDIMEGNTPKYVERVFPEELTKAELETEDEPEAEQTTEGDAEPEATEDATPDLSEVTFDPDAKIADLKALGTDAGLKITARSKADVVKALEAAGATAKAAEASAPKEETKPKAAAKGNAKGNAKADTKASDKPKADDKAKSGGIKPTPVVEISDMASVREILAEQDALDAAKSLVERAEQTDFTLGGVLRHIHETGAFKAEGYDGKRGFDDYVRQALGVEPRKARYLMSNYTVFAMIGADEQKLASIGWSKAKELARIEPAKLKKDFDKLIDKANSMTRDDLVADIKKHYKVTTRGSADGVSLTTMTFKLAEEDATTVTEGLKEASALIGADDLNKALAYIVGDWRGTGTGTDLSLEDTVELMCAKFGLESVSFVKDGETVEYTPDTEETEEQETAEAAA